MAIPDPMERFAEARAGSSQALGEMLDGCRLYLLGIAERELDPTLRGKAGASDLVQQTFMEAQQDFPRFHGDNEAELLAWLRRLLLNNMANFVRHYRYTHKRAAGLELSLAGNESQDRPELDPADHSPSASSLVRRDEDEVALQAAMASLPLEYRQVLAWRYEEELSFTEIGERLNRTANAAQKLWFRAVEQLRKTLEESP